MAVQYVAATHGPRRIVGKNGATGTTLAANSSRRRPGLLQCIVYSRVAPVRTSRRIWFPHGPTTPTTTHGAQPRLARSPV